jgi:hypothetical protein
MDEATSEPMWEGEATANRFLDSLGVALGPCRDNRSPDWERRARVPSRPHPLDVGVQEFWSSSGLEFTRTECDANDGRPRP